MGLHLTVLCAKSLHSSHLRVSSLDPLGTFHLRAKPALSFELPKTSGIKGVISKSSYSRHMYCYLFLLLQILMSSSSGSNVIRIHTASYGRTDKTTCSAGRPANQLSRTDCSASTTLPIVRERWVKDMWPHVSSTANQFYILPLCICCKDVKEGRHAFWRP